ncbi:MAG: hypothetical protein V8T46_03605 [Sutterella seckii]
MKIVYQSFDPSVNPGLFPSATVKELKTAGDDIALRLCGVIDFEAFRPECAEAAEKYWRQQQLANLGLAGNDAQQKLDLKLDEAKERRRGACARLQEQARPPHARRRSDAQGDFPAASEGAQRC